ncbi:hypothetical protein KIPB_004852, partial [Kipferlia bialata]|eukprot:g4852.t1
MYGRATAQTQSSTQGGASLYGVQPQLGGKGAAKEEEPQASLAHSKISATELLSDIGLESLHRKFQAYVPPVIKTKD